MIGFYDYFRGSLYYPWEIKLRPPIVNVLIPSPTHSRKRRGKNRLTFRSVVEGPSIPTGGWLRTHHSGDDLCFMKVWEPEASPVRGREQKDTPETSPVLGEVFKTFDPTTGRDGSQSFHSATKFNKSLLFRMFWVAPKILISVYWIF